MKAALQFTSVLHGLSLGLYSLALAAALAGLSGRRHRLAAGAAAGLAAGLIVQLALLAVRWTADGHFPVTGLFESLHFLALWVAALILYFHLSYRASGLLPSGLVLVLAALAGATCAPREIVPLTPALDTPLFFLHVATSFAAYGLFGVAALVGLHRLAGSAFAAAGPGRRLLDESLYLGYLLYTGTMLAGSLWAYLAWGSYWTWNTKGLWSYLLWFYYSGVIHVRGRAWWQGWPLCLLAVVGFLLTLFTFLGLGLLLKTNHPLL